MARQCHIKLVAKHAKVRDLALIKSMLAPNPSIEKEKRQT